MKVLEVASSLRDWGGIERYVLYLSQGLIARGHEVEVTCTPGSPLAQKLEFKHHRLALRGKHSLVALGGYLRLLRVGKYDLLHVHFSPDFLMPAYAARLTGKPKVVLTRHVALRWSSRKVRLYGKLFDHIIPVSHAVERKLKESGIPEGRMTVAKAGCPALERTRPVANTREQLGMKDFAVGCFGRLVKEKGVETLLGTSGQELHIFGDGPRKVDLEKQAASRECTKFHGYVQDVSDAMGAVDAVAIPSVWEEAFPYAALEAMSLARPIVASEIGGLPEMVTDGINGLLFAPGDSADLNCKLEELRSDPSYAAKMGEAGKLLHEAEYTIPRMSERIETVFHAVLSATR